MELTELADLVIYLGAVAGAAGVMVGGLWLAGRRLVAPLVTLWLDRRLEPLRQSSAATTQGLDRIERRLDELIGLTTENRRAVLDAQRLAVEALSTARVGR